MIEIGSDCLILYNGLIDNNTQGLINDATMTGRLLLARDRSQVSTFGMQASGSGGNYTGLISHTVTALLPDQEPYVLEFSITTTGGTRRIVDNQEVAGYGQA